MRREEVTRFFSALREIEEEIVQLVTASTTGAIGAVRATAVEALSASGNVQEDSVKTFGQVAKAMTGTARTLIGEVIRAGDEIGREMIRSSGQGVREGITEAFEIVKHFVENARIFGVNLSMEVRQVARALAAESAPDRGNGGSPQSLDVRSIGSAD